MCLLQSAARTVNAFVVGNHRYAIVSRSRITADAPIGLSKVQVILSAA
jgi:hypothetical protein